MTSQLEEIETYSGMGQIYAEDGKLVGEAKYELRVLQKVYKFTNIQGDQTCGRGNTMIKGEIKLLNGDSSSIVWDDKLVLHLENGSRLDFFYTSYPVISARSEMYQP